MTTIEKKKEKIKNLIKKDEYIISQRTEILRKRKSRLMDLEVLGK